MVRGAGPPQYLLKTVSGRSPTVYECPVTAQAFRSNPGRVKKVVTLRYDLDGRGLVDERSTPVAGGSSVVSPARRAIGAVILVAACVTPAFGQEDPDDLGRRLLATPGVRAPVDAAIELEAAVVADQIALCEIPAPPFQEQTRAEAFRARLTALGLEHVRIDAVGNVLGERPGRHARPHLVFSAHLDTVFPEGTDVSVTRDGDVLHGPGIGDDCRGLAVVLGVARTLDSGAVETAGPITFVGTVGEEGLGDLRGVTHARRLIGAIADFDVPSDPKTTFTVGRVGGGTSINAIAAEAWLEVDLRSEDPATLAALDGRFRRAVQTALAGENARWGSGGRLRVETEVVGQRPAGRTPLDAPLVRATLAVSAALNLPLRLSAGSTDANLPMSLGIPAITIDGGGRGSGAHALHETFDLRDSALGSQRAILLAVALTEP